MKGYPPEVCWDGMGIFGYLTSHEAYCLCVGNHSGHNLHTQESGDMKMKGQPNRDSKSVENSSKYGKIVKFCDLFHYDVCFGA